MADNMRKFSELYGIATQLINLGGNILNNAQGTSGSTGSASGTPYQRNSINYGSGFDGGNGIFNEVVRPQHRGIPNVETSAIDGSNNNGGLSSLFSEYGGGPLGSGSKSQPRSIFDTLMGSFLGSSIGPSGQSSSNFFSPSFEDNGGSSSKFTSPKQSSNIEALVNVLSRGGVKQGESQNIDNPTSFLTQLFGKKR